MSPLSNNSLKYNFAHIALPIVASGNPERLYNHLTDKNGEDYLISIFLGLAKKMGFHQVPPGLSLTKKRIIDDHEAFTIQLPKPNKSPEAFYVALVYLVNRKLFKKEVKSVRYFTLELGPNILNVSNDFFLCEWVGSYLQGRKHINHGQLSNAQKATFIEAIKELL